jgi:cysteine desulfurase/selenocysteine lyase
MDVRAARRLFPGVTKKVQLNAAGLSIPSTRSVEAIQRFLDQALADPQGAYHGDDLPAARREAARLVGARPGQIALLPATSLGLVVVADAVPLAAGDNVVTTDLEFMSVVVPWLEKCRAVGAELRVARHQEGRLAAERVTGLIDHRTRAVVLSSVLWVTGYRVDVAAIGRACRRRDVPLVVDAIQQVGVLPLDVEESAIDYLLAGGHKWLANPTALGFAYVSDRFAGRYRPTLSYAPTAIPPAGDWQTSWTDPDYDPIQTYQLRPDASRFEIGAHHAALSAAGLAGALSVFNEVGVDRIAEHVLALGDRLAAGLRAQGLAIVTSLERAHRSGIITFRAGAAPADDVALRDFLLARDVMVSVRFTSGVGGVRVSLHVFNDEDDVDRLLAAVDEWRRR